MLDSISGPRNCSIMTISFDCTIAIWFMGIEIAEILQLLGPEMLVMLKRSYIRYRYIGLYRVSVEHYNVFLCTAPQLPASWQWERKSAQQHRQFIYQAQATGRHRQDMREHSAKTGQGRSASAYTFLIPSEVGCLVFNGQYMAGMTIRKFFLYYRKGGLGLNAQFMFFYQK